MKTSGCKLTKPLKISAIVMLLSVIIVTAGFSQALGDVNNNGSIDIVDALLTAQYYVGLDPVNFNPEVADVNANGNIDIIDSLLIAQYYVGLITVFPGQPTGDPPVSEFTISNITPAVGESITFDASSSVDPDGTIDSYEWDFQDGTTATGMTVTHAYSTVDDYHVDLFVTDNDGNTDKADHWLFVGRPSGWTTMTHHTSTSPHYDIVYEQDTVLRIDITISPDNFQVMEDNLDTLDKWSTEEPIYVPVTVDFNGYTWWNVGMRYKGTDSLFSTKDDGCHKYPFRLDTDEFEDTYPEIFDQRFYGFEEITFCNNWKDETFLREKICADIFRNGGVPSAKNSFCRIFIDTGSGPVYWGLYTIVEDPSNKLIDTQFDDDNGNLYKPEGTGADWTTPFIQAAFVKKTNQNQNDWSDVEGTHAALHASRTDAAAWRAVLDTYFNSERFLRWLAINTAIINWDSYGKMAQNYYIYQDLTDDGRLVWIPWDFNLSLTSTSAIGGDPLSLSLSEVGSDWPLIRYLMDDSVYNNRYHQELQTAITGCFKAADVIAKIEDCRELIRPYVVGAEGEISGYTFLTNGETGFNQAVTDLINHVSTRQTEVTDYLNSR